MPFLSNEQITVLKTKISSDPILLKKIYKSKKKDHYSISEDHNLVDDLVKIGWIVDERLKTKTKLYKPKTHSKKFEDDIWCQFYELGFTTLNVDETLELPFGSDPKDKKQIDVLAMNNEAAIIIECKSSEKFKKAPSYKDEFDVLGIRLDGFKKSIRQLLGYKLRTKYVFATRNLRIDPDGVDFERFKKTNSYLHNDGSYDYLNSIIKNYKGAAKYQFMGLLFKNQLINNDKIEIPAVQGEMGGLKYYMFSIEPGTLLKMGFILHRTKANAEDMPTYQRLLVPSRLKGITKFIDGPDGLGGGFFPNSIIINFNSEKNKIVFEAGSKSKNSSARFGMLKLPNAHSIAYIIDGQHRLYGYANSKFKDTNTIPVVAFTDLTSIMQLEMFMNINQNQKAVSPSLRLTLEEDLYWDAPRADQRLKALKSSIVKVLCTSNSSPLMNRISIGEDKAELTMKPFITALNTSGLLPNAKGNKYSDKNLNACLYNTNNNDHDKEMIKSKRSVSKLIELAYSFIEENYPLIFEKERYFILSNRGTYAFINIIGSLNIYLTDEGVLSKKSTPKDRLAALDKYLTVLCDGINSLGKEKENKYLTLIGAGADIKWLRLFQSLINKKLPGYNPIELIEWRERNDEKLQTEGAKYCDTIERYMKERVIGNLKVLFGNNWDLEIGDIKRNCITRAELEKEEHYKQFGEQKNVEWTEMFQILDYKKLIEKYWSKKHDDQNFIPFENLFSLDVGFGFSNKTDKTKWIAKFNSLRRNVAHSATKNTGLSISEVELLSKMDQHCKVV